MVLIPSILKSQQGCPFGRHIERLSVPADDFCVDLGKSKILMCHCLDLVIKRRGFLISHFLISLPELSKVKITTKARFSLDAGCFLLGMFIGLNIDSGVT